MVHLNFCNASSLTHLFIIRVREVLWDLEVCLAYKEIQEFRVQKDLQALKDFPALLDNQVHLAKQAHLAQ